MIRLQGYDYHSRKANLVPVGYSVTRNGNICLFFKGGFKHYLNEQEKAEMDLSGLPELDFHAAHKQQA